MASKSQRAAVILAGLFFMTSVGTAGYVIWQIKNQEKQLDNNPVPELSIPADTTPKLAGSIRAEWVAPEAPYSELGTVDTVEGTGEVVPEGAKVTAKYTGWTAVDGKSFDTTQDRNNKPAEFTLIEGPTGVIPGFARGIVGMKVGGKRLITMPVALAYGADAATQGRPAGDLVFEVEVVSIVPVTPVAEVPAADTAQ
jgi:hypothetical protein